MVKTTVEKTLWVLKTAAQGIFGKSISELNLPQAAFIAGLPQSPSIYTPYRLNGKIKRP